MAGIYFRGREYIICCGYKAITPFLEPLEERNIFDLASLTKPLALVFVIMKMVENSRIDLFDPIKKYVEIKGSLGKIPVYRFLNHTAGLKSWYPFYKEKKLYTEDKLDLKKVAEEITALSLEYLPGEKSVYSDLGYYLLTYMLETYVGKGFEKIFNEFKEKTVGEMKKGFLEYNPLLKGIDQEEIVPTSLNEEGKILRGVVEDENTRAMGGVSGVAGLFADIYGLLEMLKIYLLSYYQEGRGISRDVIKFFWEYKEKNTDFVLGFMLQSEKGYSATGRVFSEKTVGHTGFTGTSFFIDPEKELIVILLTNRVHPDRNNKKIKDFRVSFHKVVAEIFK